MLRIDGATGEGGGQILRSSLALSILTGTPFRVENIRARRKNPGLQRQHLTAVRAAARVGNAEMEGASIGSQALNFSPQGCSPGVHHFDVGSAGSAMLVLQTVLPPLLCTTEPSELVLEGGTHNPWAPPFEFLEKSFLPVLGRMGADVSATLDRRGFFPAGGGRVAISIRPAPKLGLLELHDRGEIKALRATAVVARLPADIARRELAVLVGSLSISRNDARTIEDTRSRGPGNVVFVEVESASGIEVFTGVGKKGVRAEAVAETLADEVRRYLDQGAPVGEHRADQLLIPLALAGTGGFTTGPLSGHTETNLEVIAKFLPVRFTVTDRPGGLRRIDAKQS